MRRFDRLELDDVGQLSRSKPENQPDARAADHDEHYWLKMAGNERRKGLHESALRYYSRALEMDKSLVSGWAGQVQMLIALDECPEADLWSRKALEIFKNNPDLLAARAQALCRIGDLKNAQASCDAALSQPGLSCYPWVTRGEFMLATREDIDAYCFDKATQLDNDWLVTLEIGAIYLHYDRATKALKRIRAAVEQAPEHGYCWYCQGACELALGLAGPAARSFERCLELVPNHSLARQSLHEIRQNRGVFRNLFHRVFRFS
jgi:tetratricopeptide (TPR) repeat protein